MTQTLPTALPEIAAPTCTFGTCTNTATVLSTTSYPAKQGMEAFDWLGALCPECVPAEHAIAAVAGATVTTEPVPVVTA
jgi:hypothetical protein